MTVLTDPPTSVVEDTVTRYPAEPGPAPTILFVVRPVWPAGPGDQQMMMHLEIKVDDLEASVAHAVAQGATLAGFQPQEDVRVCLDPAGHPFCLYL